MFILNMPISFITVHKDVATLNPSDHALFYLKSYFILDAVVVVTGVASF